VSDGDENDPGRDAEDRATALGPNARDLEGELAEQRRERFGPTAADIPREESETPDADEELLEPPESEAVEVDSETARSFWAAVVYVNVGLFVIVLGMLLAGFRGRTLVGAALVGLGGFSLYRSWTVYRAFTAKDDGEQDDGDTVSEDRSDDGGEDRGDDGDDEGDGTPEAD